jgi:hypothetical protein
VTDPVSPANIPAVPGKNHVVTDRLRQMQEDLNELRQTFFGVARASDGLGNGVLGGDLLGAGWGLSKPRIHVPAYPTAPYLGTPPGGAYTWLLLYSHTWKPESQLANVLVRYAVLESVVTTTAIGEFEMRWNKGQVPGPRDVPTTGSFLFDSWDSGTPGTKGTDGSLIRTGSLQLPSTGPYAVTYWDPAWVTVGVWGRIRTATGGVNDAATVAPLGLYQSGIGQG